MGTDLEIETRHISVLKELCESDSVVREVLLLSYGDDLVSSLGVCCEDLFDESWWVDGREGEEDG